MTKKIEFPNRWFIMNEDETFKQDIKSLQKKIKESKDKQFMKTYLCNELNESNKLNKLNEKLKELKEKYKKFCIEYHHELKNM